MASYGKKSSRANEYNIRRITRALCIILFIVLVFFWEPFGGMLGSAWWTVLMALGVLALTGVDCYVDLSDHKRAGIAAGPVSYRMIVRAVLAVLGILLLVLICWQAGKEQQEQSGYYPDQTVSMSDVFAQ